MRIVIIIASALLLAACDSDPNGTPDAGSADGSVEDADPRDAAAVDSTRDGSIDCGSCESGTCASSGQCVCDAGWAGAACDECADGFEIVGSRCVALGACGEPTGTAVAIPFDLHVVQGHGRWVTLAATSSDIEHHALNDGWPRRYKAFRIGDGGGAITAWRIHNLPPSGILYDGLREVSEGDVIEDPDELFYRPDDGFEGKDAFGYCASDSTGQSEIAQVSLQVSPASTYPMPIGVPRPDFGIDEEPPSDPGEWPEAESEGFYFIDSDAACDDSLTYGSPSTPRCTIPTSPVVEAGKKMVLAPSEAGYPLRDNGWHQISLLGSAESPAWLVGDEHGPNKPRILLGPGRTIEQFRIAGSHYRISGVELDGPNLDHRTDGADNVVFRYSRVRRYLSTAGGGSTVGLATGGTGALAFHVNAADNGDISPTFEDERDIHAFVGTNQTNFWMLDVLCSENAGDCVQLTNRNTTENVYVGRALMHSMMENCIDFKDFNNFVVSESDCWDTRRVSYTSGSGGNAQNFYVNDEGVQQGYGYFLNNRSWDTSGAAYGSANIGGRVYFIGNRVFFSPAGTGLSSAGGGGERHYYFNTVRTVRQGIFMYVAGDPIRFAAGNVIDDASQYGAFVAAAVSNLDGLDHNQYSGSPTFAWGSNSTPNEGTWDAFREATGFESSAQIDADPNFLPPVDELRIAPKSVVADCMTAGEVASAAPGIAAAMRDLGLTPEDFDGNPRVADTWTCGAHAPPSE